MTEQQLWAEPSPVSPSAGASVLHLICSRINRGCSAYILLNSLVEGVSEGAGVNVRSEGVSGVNVRSEGVLEGASVIAGLEGFPEGTGTKPT